MSVAPRGSDCGGGATADVEQQSAGARKSVPPLPPRRCGCACWAMLTRRRRPLVLLALLAAAGLLAGLLGGLLPRGGGGGGAPPPQLVVVLVVSRGWAAGSTPGGAGRSVVLVNGTSPGPVLRVPTGWRLRVRLVNALDDSTTIHLHGLNTAATPWADGTPGLSQCPLGNGTGSNTLDYDVLVTVAPGTYVYHGHYRQQTLDGFYGVLIVEPSPGAPLASPYTEEWVWPMQDWYDTNSLPLAAAYAASASGNEPRPDATAVDGRLQALTQPVRGAAAVVLLRLAVPGGFSPFNFSVDGLPLTVVALDGVSVAPFDVPWLIVDVGQRADLRLNFSRLDPGLAAAGGGGGAVYFYVKRLPFMQAFFQSLGTPLGPDFCGVLTFDGSAPRYARGAWSPPPPSAAPGGWPAAPLEANLLGLASPLDAAAWPLPAATHRLNASFTFAALGRNGSTPGGAINRGFISFGGGPLRTFVPPTAAVLKQPLLFKYLAPGGAPYPFQAAAPAAGAFAAAGAARALAADANGDVLLPHGAVVDLTLFNWDSAPHPFHLHGRKLWLLATSGASPITAPGEGDPAAAYAAFVEPTDDPAVAAAGATGVLVRDVFTVPTGPPDGPGSGPPGWARVRFVADRPGVWFFHCHIEWHMASGLSAVVYEALDVLQASAAAGQVVLPQQQARSWGQWAQVDNCANFDVALQLALLSNWNTSQTAVDPGR